MFVRRTSVDGRMDRQTPLRAERRTVEKWKKKKKGVASKLFPEGRGDTLKPSASGSSNETPPTHLCRTVTSRLQTGRAKEQRQDNSFFPGTKTLLSLSQSDHIQTSKLLNAPTWQKNKKKNNPAWTLTRMSSRR